MFRPEPLTHTLVIGFGHKARQGKDTAAKILTTELPEARRFAFADALYGYCRVAHGMTVKDAPLLQRVGVERREIDEDIWIKTLYYDLLDKQPEIAIITDVRFPNEAEFIKSLGGFLVRVERFRFDEHGAPRRVCATDRDPEHPSEIALDSYTGWDAVLVNEEGMHTMFQRDVLNCYDRLLDTWRNRA